MRKFVMGLLVGAALMFSTQAFGASVSLIGKKITHEVKVKIMGEELEKKAILIDGTTYVPLRVISENLGLQTEYVNGEVVVRNKSVEQKKLESQITNKKREIEDTKKGIDYLNSEIASLEQADRDNPGKTDWLLGTPKERIANIQPRLTEAKTKLATLEAELSELEKKKAELEAQQ